MSKTPKTTAATTTPAVPQAAAPTLPAGVPPPGAVTLPLSATIQAAYHDLYNAYEAQIEASSDPAVLQALNGSQEDVGNILIKNSEYQIAANTALFTALQTQIASTNTDLKTVQKQITAIASKMAMAGTILNAINKVLTLVGA